MKILTVIDSLRTGGAEKLVADLLSLINEKENIQMDLLLLDGTETPLQENSLRNKAYNVFSLQKGNIHNPMLIFKIIKYLRGYDLVHVHLFPASYWVALAKIISFNRVKLVFTEHSTYNKRRDNLLFRYADKLIYSIYTKVICISDLVYEKLEEHLSFSDKKFSIINNGVNLDDIHAAVAYRPSSIFAEDSPGTKYIIQVSSFRYPKDQKTLIRAIGLLPATYKLILIGDGPLKAESEEFSREQQLENRIHFLGMRSDVFSFLKMADVIVLSSYYEGLSLSSIEGMASGKPFVASRVPGLEDILSGAGMLFQPGDYKSLAEMIEKLCNDEGFRGEVIKNCMERAMNFDINKTAEQYIKTYKELLYK